VCELPEQNRKHLQALGIRAMKANLILHSFSEFLFRQKELGVELSDDMMGDVELHFHGLYTILKTELDAEPDFVANPFGKHYE
jgi:hypothetical protein